MKHQQSANCTHHEANHSVQLKLEPEKGKWDFIKTTFINEQIIILENTSRNVNEIWSVFFFKNKKKFSVKTWGFGGATITTQMVAKIPLLK